MRKHLVLLSVISAFAFTGLRAQEYRIKSAGCSSNGDYLIETIVSSPHALSKNEAKVLLRRCAVTGLLFQGAEATACYAACAPLLSSRASQEELADSISKNGSLSGIAELVSPITARKISRKHQYEYPLANRNKHEPTAPPCSCARFAVILPIFQERASRNSWVYGQ